MKLGRNLRARALWIPILLAGWSLPGHLLAQARATFKLGEVTAAPGATDVSLPISIEVPPETGFVQAWALAVKYDPAVLAGVVITSTRQTDAFTFVPDGGYAEPGTVSAELYYTVDAWNSPTPGVNSEDDGVIAELRFCVPPSASPGVYPVEFASATAAQCPRATFATWYVAGGQRYFTPPVQGGTVTIGGPSLPGGGCPPDNGATLPPAPAELTVAFQLGDVTVPPGATDVSLPISIEVPPRAGRVQGWTMVVRYDPAALGKVTIENFTRLAQIYARVQPWEFVEAGTAGATLVYRFGEPDGITARDDGTIAELKFCVLPTAPPGVYPVEFLPVAVTRPEAQHPALVMSYTAEGMTYFRPPAGAGTVTIEGPPAGGGECPQDKPPSDPPQFTAAYKLQGGSAIPGGTARIPFIINASAEVLGFSLSVDFDEEVLQATEVERVFQKPDGSKWDFERFEFDNANAVPGNAGVDEGFITGAGVFSFTERITLPANTDDEALAFHFRVLPEAPFGTTEVRFVDGAQFPSGGPPIQNAVTMVTPEDSTDLSCPDSEIAPLFIVGRVQIVPDISIFIRGDSNGDQVVNISDAQATLGYLFLGARQPTCLDAADANDDGKVDVSDPISTLDSLFLGGGALPPPNATPAEDPTPDSLGCSFQ